VSAKRIITDRCGVTNPIFGAPVGNWIARGVDFLRKTAGLETLDMLGTDRSSSGKERGRCGAGKVVEELKTLSFF